MVVTGSAVQTSLNPGGGVTEGLLTANALREGRGVETHSLTLALALEFGLGGDLESLEPPVLSDGDLDMFNRGVRQEDHLVLPGVERDAGVARRYPFDIEVAAGCGRDDNPHGKRVPFLTESLDAESELPHEELAVEHDTTDDRPAGMEDVAPLKRRTDELVQRVTLTLVIVSRRRRQRDRATVTGGTGAATFLVRAPSLEGRGEARTAPGPTAWTSPLLDAEGRCVARDPQILLRRCDRPRPAP